MNNFTVRITKVGHLILFLCSIPRVCIYCDTDSTFIGHNRLYATCWYDRMNYFFQYILCESVLSVWRVDSLVLRPRSPPPAFVLPPAAYAREAPGQEFTPDADIRAVQSEYKQETHPLVTGQNPLLSCCSDEPQKP